MSAYITELWSAFEIMRPWIGGSSVLLGALLSLVGTIGVMRFPDFYTRLHAAGITDTLGATLVLVGMAFLAPDLLVVFKLLAIWVFLFFTGPTSSHAVANAAYKAGVQPIIGHFTPGDSDGGPER